MQPDFAGGNRDVVLALFNSSGTDMLYCTFLGGSGADVPISTVVHPSGDLFLMGVTDSKDFPTTSAAFGRDFNSSGPGLQYIGFASPSDIFVSSLNFKGTRLGGSTYVGGSGADGVSKGRKDRGSSNVWITGR